MRSPLQIKTIQLKGFRCFENEQLSLDAPLVLIEGDNGVGKTSLLEAVHYLCYLRSFRTHKTQEVVRFANPGFFIKIVFTSQDSMGIDEQHELQVGFEAKKRSVKMNQKSIRSYKELMDYFRVVTLTEDDLSLIQGAPEIRRSFIDQVLVLENPDLAQSLREYRTIVSNKNALLHKHTLAQDLYDVWTDQVWYASRDLQEHRKAALKQLEQNVNELLKSAFGSDIVITFEYMAQKKSDSFEREEFFAKNPMLYDDERRFGRALFGAHLDDFSIIFQHKKSRDYASRGQQKLIIVLIKIAQLQHLSKKRGSAIFLLDDFMTDFDENTVKILVSLLADLPSQLIFTTPSRHTILTAQIAEKPHLKLKLPN
ncbi:MAG: DNA replication and repair protein RecF [Candidatus Babeliales bacterium]